MEKIIFFSLIGPDYPGGCENYFSHVIQYLSAKKYNIKWVYSTQFYNILEKVYSLLYRKNKPFPVFRRKDIKDFLRQDIPFFSFFPLHPSHRKIKLMLLSADAIYTKNESQELFFLYLMLGKNEYKKRVIVGVHSAIFIPNEIKGIWKIIHDILYSKIFYGFLLRCARKIHVLNEEYKILLFHNYGVLRNNVVFIPNPILWNSSLGPKQQKFTILWSGRLSTLKGVERLVHILKKLSRLYPNEFQHMQIIIASEGGDKENEIIQLTNQFPNVIYLHYVNDMEPLYRNSSLYLSTSYFETFGYAMLEAQSFGVPVLSFDTSGAKAIIESGKTGWIVMSESECIKILCKYYYTFTKKADTISAIRKDTYIRTKKTFAKEKIYSQIENLLR